MRNVHTNALINETSPYLLQHAHNPVNWLPWSEEALRQAKSEDKVILVSIGYSACHWCHVMEKESFEDEATAAVMNQHFINIKIDREERPDIDHIYMDAVQAMTGSGGWPLNVFLTPDGKPFYGGTYFPPVRAYNRASWKEVLAGVAQAWKDRRQEILDQAENLTSHISKQAAFINMPVAMGAHRDACKLLFENIMQSADRTWGGFGRAPKFPQTFTIRNLFAYYHLFGEQSALDQAVLSVDKMINGGIYDQVGGGLARYSTDNEWLAPHFEKMLYDNALLIMALCDAYQLTGQVRYHEVLYKTIGFVIEQLNNETGGFYAALDADSEGEEGRFYVWQKQEIKDILGGDAGLFCECFDITETGNWEGKNIPRMLKPITQLAAENGIGEKALTERLNSCLAKLKTARNLRVSPGLDDKLLLGWNAMMTEALARAAVVLQDDEIKDKALKAGNFLLSAFKASPEKTHLMFHTWKNGVAKYPAFLDDYACMGMACIALYQLNFDENWLLEAKNICSYVIDTFSDEAQLMFYYTHVHQKDVITRKKELYDGATPSGNALMAALLQKTGIIFDRPDWKERANRMLDAITAAMLKYPTSFGVWAGLFLNRAAGITEIAVTGDGAHAMALSLQSETYLPGCVMMASEKENTAFPMLAGKKVGNRPEIYVCKDYMCLSPVATINDFRQLLFASK